MIWIYLLINHLDNSKNEFKAILNYYIVKAGYSKSELAIKIHISKASLYAKIKSPDKFTIREIKSIKNVLGIPEKDLMCILD